MGRARSRPGTDLQAEHSRPVCALCSSIGRSTRKVLRRAISKFDSVEEVPWTADDDIQQPSRTVSVFVDELKRGSRKLPRDLTKRLKAHPEALAFVVSKEPLVRPVIYLSPRVTLFSTPVSHKRFRTELASALTTRAVHPPYGRHSPVLRMPETRSGASTVEYLKRRFWAGGLSAGASPLWSPILDPTKTPGTLALITQEDHIPAVPELLQLLAKREESEATLVATLGKKAGLIYLPADAAHWIVYWPTDSWPLWLFSPARLPECWDLAGQLKAAGRRFLKMQTEGNDLVCGFSNPLPQSRSIASSEEMQRFQNTAKDGGPSVLEFALERIKEAPMKFSGAAMEVR